MTTDGTKSNTPRRKSPTTPIAAGGACSTGGYTRASGTRGRGAWRSPWRTSARSELCGSRTGSSEGQNLPDQAYGEEGAGVGHRAHVNELQNGPLPSAGFAAHDGAGRHTLHGKCKEDEQGKCAAGREVAC